MHASRQEHGFTLLELSIVIVILGLIVGGALAGQSLIQAAETRAIIADVDRFRAATSTFRTRFKDLPGDARAFRNFADLKKYPYTKNGNGDKRVQQCYENEAFYTTRPAACTVYGSSWENVGGRRYDYLNQYTGELLGFWQHLSVAGLINGDYNGLPVFFTGTGAPPLEKRAKPGTSYPAFRTNGALGWVAYSGKYERGQLFLTPGAASGYALDSHMGITTPNSDPALIINAVLTPTQAWLIDMKGDDGMPKSGGIRGGVGNGNGTVTISMPGLILGIFQRTEGAIWDNSKNYADPCSSFMASAADYAAISSLDPIYISQNTVYNTGAKWEAWAEAVLYQRDEEAFDIRSVEDRPSCTMRFAIQ